MELSYEWSIILAWIRNVVEGEADETDFPCEYQDIPSKEWYDRHVRALIGEHILNEKDIQTYGVLLQQEIKFAPYFLGQGGNCIHDKYGPFEWQSLLAKEQLDISYEDLPPYTSYYLSILRRRAFGYLKIGFWVERVHEIADTIFEMSRISEKWQFMYRESLLCQCQCFVSSLYQIQITHCEQLRNTPFGAKYLIF